jgi:nucleotide-binding universal stress UspA family protein
MAHPDQTSMFDTIVWATDGSARSDAAFGYVRDACERHGSSLRIVHVARPLAGGGDREIAKLKAMTSSLRRHGVRASLHVVRGAIGSAAPHIAEVARMADAGLVIVTSRGRSPLLGAVAGSVTQRLLAEAPCPVLILPPPAVPEAIRHSA